MARRSQMLVALVAACGLLWSPAFVSPRQATPRAARTQLYAEAPDGSGLLPGGPLVVYNDALSEAAAKTGEAVPVTKDMMKIKAKFQDEDFLDEMIFVMNGVGASELEKAEGMLKLLEPLESTVVPKFVSFLAKKKRLLSLKPLSEEYVTNLYQTQGIAPVTVKSAQALTPEQVEAIKEKMKVKTGASDIKLMQVVDPTLIGGLVVEWGYTDPENSESPTEGVDLSLKNILEKSALKKGVSISL